MENRYNILLDVKFYFVLQERKILQEKFCFMLEMPPAAAFIICTLPLLILIFLAVENLSIKTRTGTEIKFPVYASLVDYITILRPRQYFIVRRTLLFLRGWRFVCCSCFIDCWCFGHFTTFKLFPLFYKFTTYIEKATRKKNFYC